uniref:Uncharacterized protein n=1 Tax=Kalanchoe fedtschenkoi TaxID=63787 RepID=A0A7N0UIX7_KALFE
MAMMSAISQSLVSASVHQPDPARLGQVFSRKSNSAVARSPFRSVPKIGGVAGVGVRNGGRLLCNSSMTPGGSGSGDNESKSVLDAFFLGKAVAEALSERIESTVGEILSTVGRLQAEQQKQVQEFQEEVLERAKRAKETAAREAKELQGLPVKSTTTNASVVKSTTYSAAAGTSATIVTPNNKDSGSNENDPVIGVSNNV